MVRVDIPQRALDQLNLRTRALKEQNGWGSQNGSGRGRCVPHFTVSNGEDSGEVGTFCQQ